MGFIRFALRALTGGGKKGDDPEKDLGYVTKNSHLPTTRKDGSPLQNEDYVTASGVKADFPFTINGVTFTNPLQKAYYDKSNNIWLPDFGTVVSSDEVTIKNKLIESLSKKSNYQNEINTEVVKAINGYTHTQINEALDWNIKHNFDVMYPSSIKIYNAGNEIFGSEYEAIDKNTGTLHFKTKINGIAKFKFGE